MIVLGVVIAISIFITIGICDVCDDYCISGNAVFVSSILFSICIVGACICFGMMGQSRIIDEKIKMYQKENKQIEKQIDTLVKEYTKYESNTLKEFSNKSNITLVTMYPNLKSDELVKSQINTYTENNKKIKELKEDKLNYKLAKWWLYFGGD